MLKKIKLMRTRKRKYLNRIIELLALVISLSLFGAGCGINKDTKIVLTTGFAKDEVFKIGDINCNTSEMMVYLTNLQNQYEAVYGEDIWNTSIDGVTLEENVKEVALSRMAQVKTMTLLAGSQGIVLDDTESRKVNSISDIYYDSLSQTEIEAMGIDRDTIVKLYTEYALSTKVYESIIKDVNPEISDDEARTITVEHIFIKTFNYDDDGNKVSYDAAHKNEARTLAQDIRQRIVDGEDLTTLAREYSDDEEVTMSFGMGEQDEAFEKAAFELGSDELSKVVETELGYYIIRCLSTFNREVTDENKIKIVEKRKQEAFSQEYESFAGSLTKDLNHELWDSIEFVHGDDIDTHDFFEIFDKNYIR